MTGKSGLGAGVIGEEWARCWCDRGMLNEESYRDS